MIEKLYGINHSLVRILQNSTSDPSEISCLAAMDVSVQNMGDEFIGRHIERTTMRPMLYSQQEISQLENMTRTERKETPSRGNRSVHSAVMQEQPEESNSESCSENYVAMSEPSPTMLGECLGGFAHRSAVSTRIENETFVDEKFANELDTTEKRRLTEEGTCNGNAIDSEVQKQQVDIDLSKTRANLRIPTIRKVGNLYECPTCKKLVSRRSNARLHEKKYACGSRSVRG